MLSTMNHQKVCLYFFLFISIFFNACTKSDKNEERSDACNVIDLDTRSKDKGSKIVQGSECSSENSPIVNITLLPEKGGVATCSGTMLTSRHVLTAAHCYQAQSKDQDIVSSSVSVNGRDVPVDNVTIHPQYNGDVVPAQNDVAVVLLDREVAARTVPILLSRSLQPQDTIAIYGFGQDENEDSGVLRSGEMDIVGINGQFFYGKFQEGGSTICSGDSGGPAIIKFKSGDINKIGIVGVISFGSVPCNSDSTAGFANIQSSSVLSFLSEILPNLPTV
jgi:secreted trypsin-like serine protease